MIGSMDPRLSATGVAFDGGDERSKVVRSPCGSHGRASKARTVHTRKLSRASFGSMRSMDEAEAGKFGGGGDGYEAPAELIVEEEKEVCCLMRKMVLLQRTG